MHLTEVEKAYRAGRLRGEWEAASRQSRSKALLAELFADLQRIDETSILPDGDWVSVCVATWAAEWVTRLKDAGLITANN